MTLIGFTRFDRHASGEVQTSAAEALLREEKQMKNFEKYKTADERTKAFDNWCDNGVGKGAFKKCLANRCIDCALRWLDLEAEDEKLLPCPYCGGKTVSNLGHLFQNKLHHWVECTNSDCMYRSGHFLYRSEVIQKHNLMVRAVMERGKES